MESAEDADDPTNDLKPVATTTVVPLRRLRTAPQLDGFLSQAKPAAEVGERKRLF